MNKNLQLQKKRFRRVFDEAEKLFAAKKYAEAQSKYLDCLKEYRKGFEPDENFINKRHAESEKYEALTNLYKSGKEAHAEGNFDLAAHYYQKANALHRSPKLEALIKDVSGKKTGITGRGKTVQKEKKKWTVFRMLKYAGFILMGLILFLFMFSQEFRDGFEEGYYEETAAEIPAVESGPAEPALNAPIEKKESPSVKENKPVKKAINYAKDIKGLWICTDVKAELADIPPLFLNARYNFLDNMVYENAIPLNYFVNGNRLNINNGVMEGRIRMPTKNRMVVSGTYNVQYIGSFPVTWTFSRN